MVEIKEKAIIIREIQGRVEVGVHNMGHEEAATVLFRAILQAIWRYFRELDFAAGKQIAEENVVREILRSKRE